MGKLEGDIVCDFMLGIWPDDTGNKGSIYIEILFKN